MPKIAGSPVAMPDDEGAEIERRKPRHQTTHKERALAEDRTLVSLGEITERLKPHQVRR